MKNFRTLLTLLVVCCFVKITNAQTKNIIPSAPEQCTSKEMVATSKSTTTAPPLVKKSLAATKQRRLKNYQYNPRITRKRKTIKLENVIAVKE